MGNKCCKVKEKHIKQIEDAHRKRENPTTENNNGINNENDNVFHDDQDPQKIENSINDENKTPKVQENGLQSTAEKYQESENNEEIDPQDVELQFNADFDMSTSQENQNQQDYVYTYVSDMGTQMCPETDNFPKNKLDKKDSGSLDLSNEDTQNELINEGRLKMKFLTKGLHIPVYVESLSKSSPENSLKDHEELSEKYDENLNELTTLLNDLDSRVDSMLNQHIPVEPNAIQEHLKVAENIKEELADSNKKIKELNSSADDLINNSVNVWTYKHNEKEIKELNDDIAQKQKDLESKCCAHCAKLNKAFEQSQSVSEQLESLLDRLEKLDQEVKTNKDVTSADCNKLKEKINDMKNISDSLNNCGEEMKELMKVCSVLLKPHDKCCEDSLQKRKDLLNDRFSEICDDATKWNNHLTDTLNSVENLEKSCATAINDANNLKQKLNNLENRNNNWNKETNLFDSTLENSFAESEKLTKEINEELQSLDKNQFNSLQNEVQTLLTNLKFEIPTLQSKIDEIKVLENELQDSTQLSNEKLDSWKENLSNLEKSSTDFKTWLCENYSCLNSIPDSLCVKEINQQLNTLEELTDSAEKHSNDVDLICEEAQFVPTFNAESLSQKSLPTNVDDAICIRDFEHFDEQYVNDIKNKTTQLCEEKSKLEDLNEKIMKFNDLLGEMEEKELSWMSKLAESNIDDLNDDTAEYKKWRDCLVDHLPQLKEIEEKFEKCCLGKPKVKEGSELEQEVQLLANRWNSLTNASEENVGLLLKKCEDKKLFYDKFERFLEWIEDKRTLFNMIDATVNDLEKLESQISQLKKLDDDIQKHKGLLTDLATLTSSLPDLKGEFTRCENLWNSLTSDVEQLGCQLDDAVIKIKLIDDIAKELHEWAEKVEDKLEKAEITTDIDQLNKLLDEIEKIKDSEVQEYTEKYDKCSETAENLTAPKKLVTNEFINNKLHPIKDDLDSTVKKLDDFEKSIQKQLKDLEKINKLSDELSSWTTETESKVDDIYQPTLLDVEQLKDACDNLKAMCDEGKEMEKTDKEMDNLLSEINETCTTKPEEKFNSSIKEPQEQFEKFIPELNEKHDSLCSKVKDLEKFHSLAEEIDAELNDIENKLEKVDKKHNEKQKETLKELSKEIEKEGEKVSELCDLSNLLSQTPNIKTEDQIKQNGIDNELTLKSDDISKKYNDLKDNLSSQCLDVDQFYDKLTNLENDVNEISTDISNLEDDLDQLEAISRELEVLEEQAQQTDDMIAQADDLLEKLKNNENKYKEMKKDWQGDKALQRDINQLLRKVKRCKKRLSERRKSISDIQNKLETLENDGDDLSNKIDNAMEHVNQADKEANCVEKIKELKSDFKDWRQDEVTPLSKKLNKVRDLGNTLIFSAEPSVPTAHIRHRVDELDNKWYKLNELLSQYDVALQQMLAEEGLFSDVYDSLVQWLDDSERIANNQSPPSWQYKVVTGQMEEHKVFQQMVNSQNELMTSFLRKNSKLDNVMDKKFDKNIKQLATLQQRWLALCSKVEERDSELRFAVTEASQFYHQSNNFKSWMEAVEKKYEEDEFVGELAERIERQLKHFKTLLHDVTQHKRHLNEIESTPLTTQMKTDELKSSLNSYIMKLKYNYEELLKMIAGKIKILEKHQHLCKLFDENQLALLAFLAETDLKLAKWENLNGVLTLIDAQPAYIDGVLKSFQEIQAELGEKKDLIEDSVLQGRQLLTKLPGDDNTLAHKTLDDLNIDYKMLLNRVDDRVKCLTDSLATSSDLDKTHKDLNTWMEDVECKLGCLEKSRIPNLTDSHELLDNIEPEKHEADVESIKRDSAQLSPLSQWWGNNLLKDTFNKDVTKFGKLSNNVDQQKQHLKDVEDEITQTNKQIELATKALKEWEIKIINHKTLKSYQEEYLNNKNANAKELEEFGKRCVVDHDKIEEQTKHLQKTVNPDDIKDLLDSVNEYQSTYNTTLKSHDHVLAVIGSFVSSALIWTRSKDQVAPWLSDMKETIPPLLETTKDMGLENQQEAIRVLKEKFDEQRPLVDKMKEVATELNTKNDEECAHLTEHLTKDTELTEKEFKDLYEKLKIHGSNLQDIEQDINKYLAASNQLLEVLNALKQRLQTFDPIELEPDNLENVTKGIQKICDECEQQQETYDNLKSCSKDLIEKLLPLGCKTLSKVVDVKQQQLDEAFNKLKNTSNQTLNHVNDTSKTLDDFCETCDSAEATLNDVANKLEAVIVVPRHVDSLTEELNSVEELVNDMEKVKGEVEKLEQTIEDCNQHQQPCSQTYFMKRREKEVKSHWLTLENQLKKLKDNLATELEDAVKLNETVASLQDSLEENCQNIKEMPTVLNDVDAIKEQMSTLKDIKSACLPLQVEAQNICAQYDDLNQSQPLRDAIENLEKAMLDKQNELDDSLIALGQLQHTVDELKEWMKQTDDLMNKTDEKLDSCDINQLESEILKHKMLMNDIDAHKSSLDSVVANLLNLSTNESDDLSQQTEELNSNWESLESKSKDLLKKMEEKLQQCKSKQDKLDELEKWIAETERKLNSTMFFGGLPETAQLLLDEHMILMGEIEDKQAALPDILEGETDEKGLKKKISDLHAQAEDRKQKLEGILLEAQSFHNNLKDFTSWLGKSEKTLQSETEQPLSVLCPIISQQLASHKAFEEGIQEKRPEISELDKVGSHLKYFSQKQDGILIKNLLLSVHARWDKLISNTSAQSVAINDIYKKSKNFEDGITKFRTWIDSAKKNLETQNFHQQLEDPTPIKTELEAHKEFQRALDSKQPVYDAVIKSGKMLHEKSQLASDKVEIEKQLRQLKQEWVALKEQSFKRKQQLEETLMFSGRFLDAIDSLIQWLSRIEPQLTDDVMVHGDIHTVDALMDKHAILTNELNARYANVEALQNSLGDQEDGWLDSQMKDLVKRWDDVSKLVDSKQKKLDEANEQAKELQFTAKKFLEHLSTVERNLAAHQKLPNDEFQLQELKLSHQALVKDMEEHNKDLNKIVELANSILTHPHPDAVTPIKQIIKVVQGKAEEVQFKCDEHGQQIDDALNKLLEDANLMKNLDKWLDEAENSLKNKEDPTPENIQALVDEHQKFQEEMLLRQPDYELLTSLYSKRKSGGKKGDGSPRSKESPSYMEGLCDNMHSKWQRVWLMTLERQRALQQAQESYRRQTVLDGFVFDDWRKRYMKWMKHKKSRVMDFFREMDSDGRGNIARDKFINSILESKFNTSRTEMEKVADIFDRDGDGFIDYYEFVAALYPTKESYKPESDADKIDDEVVRQVAKCTCYKRFQVQQIAENKYRFGDNQQLRLVRILRSTVMVRVGGGWMALDEFLIKNDPCRAKGRTNAELREKFILPEGASQGMTAFRTKRTPTPKKAQPGLNNTQPTGKTPSPSHKARPKLNATTPVTPCNAHPNQHTASSSAKKGFGFGAKTPTGKTSRR